MIRHGQVQDKVEAVQPPRLGMSTHWKCLALQRLYRLWIEEKIGEPFSIYFAIVHRKNTVSRKKFVGMMAFSTGRVQYAHPLTRHLVPPALGRACRTPARASASRTACGWRISATAAPVRLTTYVPGLGVTYVPGLYTTSRRNGRIRRFDISTTRKRLAPSIRFHNQPEGKRSKTR